MYVRSKRFYIFIYRNLVSSLTTRLPLLFLSILFLNACGGPPQDPDSNTEGPAVLSATPDTLPDFGEVLTGSSYQRTISLYNESITVNATNVAVSTNLNSPFSFLGGSYPGTGGTCSDELTAGGTCTVVIALNPTIPGNISSSFSLSYFDGLVDQSSTFTFSAQARDPIPAILSATPSGNHDFGILAIGGFSDVSYTLINSGELDATAVSFLGLTDPFSILSNSCGGTISASSSCTVTVRFSPLSQAVFNDTLNIAYNDGVNLQSINKDFTGEGRVAGFLAIDEGFDFDFGIINNGFNETQTLTVRNTGGGNASAISFSGLTAPYSVLSNNCPGTIGPAGSCTIVVRFAPTATNTFSSSPTLSYFDGFNNQNTAVNFDGQGFANNLTLSLQSPGASPSTISTPTLRVSNTINDLRIRLYSNSSCSVQVGDTLASGNFLDFSPVMAEGTYEFHARAIDDQGNLSACSVSSVDYIYDNTNPNAPGAPVLNASFTINSNSSPTFNWTGSSSPDVVDYEVGISTSALGGNDVSGWTSKGDVSFGNQTGLSLTECQEYYASVRAVDHVGLPSPHATSATSFRYDSSLPTAPSSLAEDGDASDTNSATVSWVASADTCGIAYYESAISEDTNDNGVLDASEIGNVVPFTDIGNVTTHRFNGLTLTTGINHYTSLRAVDNSGRTSSTVMSSPWIIYNPSIELPDMIVWLDGNDPTTILDAEGDDANSGSFSGNVSSWRDKSGSAVNHHFNLSGSAPTFSDADFSLTFNGSTTGMTTGNHNEINLALVEQRNITVAFKTSADVSSRQILYEEGGNIRGMNVYIFNGQLYCGFYNNVSGDGDGVQPFTWVNTAISPNTVYSVTWVYDYTHYTTPEGPDGDLTCYVNSSSVGSTPTTSRLFGHSGAVGLGHINGQSCFEDGSCPSTGSHFNGELYEVMLFNDAPDATAVTNVHTYLSNKWH